MFKLVDSGGDVVTSANSYARWLRVIGQELSRLKFICFEIEVEDRVFMIRRANGNENHASSRAKLGESVRKSWFSLPGRNRKETAGGLTSFATPLMI